MQHCVSLQTWSGSFLGSHAGGMLRILHSWALKILLMLGKAGFPLPSSYLISKHRVQNNCASLMGSQWKGDGTQSRCLSVLVNSPLKKKRKRENSQRGSETITASTVIGETNPSQVSRSLCLESRPTMKHISINSALSMTLFSKLTLGERTSKQQNPALLPHQALHKILIISLAKAGKGSFPTTEPTNYLS